MTERGRERERERDAYMYLNHRSFGSNININMNVACMSFQDEDSATVRNSAIKKNKVDPFGLLLGRV